MIILASLARVLTIVAIPISGVWILYSYINNESLFEPVLALIAAISAVIFFEWDKFRVSDDLKDDPITEKRTEKDYLNGRKRLHADLEKRFISCGIRAGKDRG